MAWFTCMAGVGGKGNSVIVTCDADFAGIPITCTNGQKTYTKVCPSFSPYEVTFSGLVAGTWTISATVDGVVYSTTAVVTDITAVLSYGFNWQKWVDNSSSLDSGDYTDLADLLGDEAAIRQLFIEHAPTDYAASTATVTPDLATVLNNDICAKWINLSDYALDTLYANPLIAAEMDNADKYFYGEWGIVDDTTTPPTWGAKGNVPVMTSNSAPCGVASNQSSQSGYEAYKAFDGDNSTYAIGSSTSGTGSGPYIAYKSSNPINVRRIYHKYSSASTTETIVVKYSDDGSTWTSTNTQYTIGASEGKYIEIPDCGYHLHWGIFKVSSTSASKLYAIALQFYGRELSVSVPKMDTNTTPYGEVFGDATGTYGCLKAFDNDPSTKAMLYASSAGTKEIGYEFTTKMLPKMIVGTAANENNVYPTSILVKGSNDGVNYTEIGTFSCSNLTALATEVYNLSASNSYKYIKLVCSLRQLSASEFYAQFSALQFYGLDYSEKEFEEGTTKKWLYDHGLELETLTASGYSISGVTLREAIKEPSQIYFDTFSSDGTGFTFMGTANAIDLTDYSYLMIRSGNKGKARSNNANFIAGMNVKTTKSADADGYINIKDMYYVNALDVSSFNQSKFATISSGAYNSYYTMTELWLE